MKVMSLCRVYFFSQRVQHTVRKKIIEPLSPKISRRPTKPPTTEGDFLTSETTKEDIVPPPEDEMIPPPEYTPRMTDAADFDNNDEDDVLFHDDVTMTSTSKPDEAVEEPTLTASTEYTELICDNLGPLRDACECNESHCFICRKRGADDNVERRLSGKCVIIEDDLEYKSRKYRDSLNEGDSVKPRCICFSIEM